MIHGWNFFLLALWVCNSTAFWLSLFLKRSQLLMLLGSLVCNRSFFFCCFQDFLFVFQHFYYNVFGCGSLYIHSTWNLFLGCRIISYIRFRMFSVIISLTTIFVPLLVLQLYTYIGVCIFWCPTFLWASLFFSLFFSFLFILHHLWSYVQVWWFFLLPAQI